MDSLVDSMIDAGIISSMSVICALRTINRAGFVPSEVLSFSYLEKPLPIGWGQTISQPSVVGLMLEMLSLEEGMRVLDVGAGSGWTTALIAQIVRERGVVLGTERIPELVHTANENLVPWRLPWAQILHSKEELGAPKEEPFDRILVSAAAKGCVPEALINQLAPGGLLVMPVDNALVRVKKTASRKRTTDRYYGFSFVPLIS